MGGARVGVRMLPYGCLGLAVLGFQFGAALVTPLIASIGAQGASALRLGLTACVLGALMRPWRAPVPRAALGWTIGYGLGLAGLNLFFYLAIRTLPLGVTVAVEFLGPLSLAVLGSRRPIDFVWAALAGLGMLCLVPAAQAGGARDLAGFGFALLSAVSWVAYILCGQRAGQIGHRAVAIGVAVAALVVLPFGIAHAASDLLRPEVLGQGLLVALVSGCLPYGLEMVALKRLPVRVFGILMSLEPAAGALFGYLLLGQRLSAIRRHRGRDGRFGRQQPVGRFSRAARQGASEGSGMTQSVQRPAGKRGGLAAELVDAEAAMAPAPVHPGSPLARLALAVSLVLVAFNLRPVFSSLAAVLPEVRVATGASPALASLFTTLPVLCLGLFAGFAPRLAHRFGAERVILALALLLAVGTALRGLGTVPALLAGSVLAGGSIAIVNVLLPGLVKRDFPDRVATLTAFYTMALCAGAAAAAGVTVPFERATGAGWQGALAAWGMPALAVALLWAPQALRPKAAERPRAKAGGRSLLREPLAWQVTGFMGLQSALAYCIFGWFAPLLRARGLDAATAGYVVSFSVVMQTAACLIAPGLATRGRSQSGINVALVGLAVVGFLGALFAPLSTIWLWAGVQGLGQGGLIAVALTVIVLRAPDAVTAARLSSMAQGFGYTLAAFGPLVMGYLFTGTGRPGSTAPLVLALGTVAAIAGFFAGRDRVLPA